MFRKVLVAVLGAGTEDPALDAAGDLARRLGSELVLAGLVPTEDGPSTVEDALEAERREAARDFLDRALRRMREQGVVPAAVEITGPPAESILDYARQQDVDLVVLASGGGPATAPIHGDLAARLVAAARVPVLTVPRAAG
ncbi:MAG TPA: universal stress protein [Dehalococcoidia bacterium]